MNKEQIQPPLPVVERSFEGITHHSQLAPRIVQGILDCVNASGLDTTQEDILNHMAGDIVAVFEDPQTQRILGFSSTRFGSPREILESAEFPAVPGCYFSGATVVKEKQSNGLYRQMNARRIEHALRRGSEIVFTVTQNPRVESTIRSVLTELTQNGIIAGYAVDRTLIPGCYGKMLTREKPVDDQISYDELDYPKGDAYALFFSLQK